MLSMQSVQQALSRPFVRFFQLQASGSILLLAATLLALVWANSPWHATYHDLWHTPILLGFGPAAFERSLHFWINDGLMAIFFLVVGLEIKRELLVGELSSPRQAALPVIAALGGVLVPALIYILLNPPGSAYAQGWGIPVVTDIAFAIGVLTILGSRVPLGLKVFLTALAIIDDLAAILIICLFYSGGLNVDFLLLALLVCLVLLVFNRARINHMVPYLAVGLILWAVILQTGLHATLSGVVLALMIPARGKMDPAAFHQGAGRALARFRDAGIPADGSVILTNHEHQASLQQLESLCEEVQAPLQRMEHTLHPWSSYVILPLFALANAGVQIEPGELGNALAHPLVLSIMAGLVLGKQLGISLFAWLGVRLGLAKLPGGVRWSGIYGAAILGGIGFTMSLFISLLSFTGEPELGYAKIGILAASLLSGLIGVLVLRQVLPRPPLGHDERTSG